MQTKGLLLYGVFAGACFFGVHSGVATRMERGARSDSSEGTPTLIRNVANGGADAPSGRLLLRVPANGQSGSGSPSPEEGEPPAEPSDPIFEDEEGDSKFNGELVGGKAIFIIDVSDSMKSPDAGPGEDWDGNIHGSMRRLDKVKTALINFLRTVDASVSFDIIWLAGGNIEPCEPPNTAKLRGELVRCTDEMREQAIQAVIKQYTWLGTPTWRALKDACELYPDDLQTLILYTDGAPFPRDVAGEWGESQVPAILADFPKWYKRKKANGCSLTVFVAGNNDKAGSFAQDLCAQNGGKYIHE
ncbi:MAG: hypothetical protein L6Q71_09465 [Planctomycetes bacterium]|nr:hypothetical protein [Planctomycetota bacterium]NUQ34206.1 hypothetical protein [Planctomycetaceae bacterium]